MVLRRKKVDFQLCSAILVFAFIRVCQAQIIGCVCSKGQLVLLEDIQKERKNNNSPCLNSYPNFQLLLHFLFYQNIIKPLNTFVLEGEGGL